MKSGDYYLLSSKPFDFGGYCCACRCRTGETIAVDVSRKKDIGMALAEIALPPFMLLDLKEVKSVRIPYCNACRLPLHLLRLFSLLAFLGLMAMLIWVISDSDSKLRNGNGDIYLIVAAFFGIILLPFIYTAIKEFILGNNVFVRDGWFHYRFTKSEILEFLEDQRLCRHLLDAPQIYVAD